MLAAIVTTAMEKDNNKDFIFYYTSLNILNSNIDSISRILTVALLPTIALFYMYLWLNVEFYYFDEDRCLSDEDLEKIRIKYGSK